MDKCQDLLINEETWEAIGDADAAELIARRLFVLREGIESGAEGAREASGVILASIEAAYLHTEAHRAALRLYLLYLTGELKPEDEPVRLINEAIERGAARVESGKKGRAARKGRREMS